jgi:phage terminase large subunit-like protein
MGEVRWARGKTQRTRHAWKKAEGGGFLTLCPERGTYPVRAIFLRPDEPDRPKCKKCQRIAAKEGA